MAKTQIVIGEKVNAVIFSDPSRNVRYRVAVHAHGEGQHVTSVERLSGQDCFGVDRWTSLDLNHPERASVMMQAALIAAFGVPQLPKE